MLTSPRLLIVGNPSENHVGAHFVRAAQQSGLQVTLADLNRAYEGPQWVRRLNWHLRHHRPTRLASFGQTLLRATTTFQPTIVLVTGIAPVNRATLIHLRQRNVRYFNFLTDDPWNPNHYAPWFMETLPYYDAVFSPRRANLSQLEQLGCRQVHYLPFAYDPTLYHPTAPTPSTPLVPDLLYVGGGDRDRVPYMTALAEAGITPTLYGGYWERYAATRPFTRGLADAATIAALTTSAKINLCLVRRANRDGHVMRSFEIAACGGCMLAEDTNEHRDIFGREGESVLYFDNPSTMVSKVQWLLAHDDERNQLKTNLYYYITTSHHTYTDRLRQMIALAL